MERGKSYALLPAPRGHMTMAKILSTHIMKRAAMQHESLRSPLSLIAASLLACTALTAPAWAQDTPATEEPKPEDDIVITGSLDALPVKDVGSVFGFNKTLVETPRAAS